MAFTFGSMANISTQSALSSAQSQANTYGLGSDETNALAIGNLMDQDEEKSLVGKLMGGNTNMNRNRNRNNIGLQSQQQTYEFGKDILSGIISKTI